MPLNIVNITLTTTTVMTTTMMVTMMMMMSYFYASEESSRDLLGDRSSTLPLANLSEKRLWITKLIRNCSHKDDDDGDGIITCKWPLYNNLYHHKMITFYWCPHRRRRHHHCWPNTWKHSTGWPWSSCWAGRSPPCVPCSLPADRRSFDALSSNKLCIIINYVLNYLISVIY